MNVDFGLGIGAGAYSTKTKTANLPPGDYKIYVFSYPGGSRQAGAEDLGGQRARREVAACGDDSMGCPAGSPHRR